MLRHEQAELAAQRLRAVRGDQGLVPPAGVHEQRTLGCVGPLGPVVVPLVVPVEGVEQGPYRLGGEEGEVGREDEHPVGLDPAQPGGQPGERPGAGRLLARPGHRADRGPPRPDDHGASGAGAGAEDPVEQGPAADPQRGLVGPAQPPGGTSGKYYRVVNRHPSSMSGTRRATRSTTLRVSQCSDGAQTVRSSTAGCSTQSATYRRNPPAVPPSHTRWSKVKDSCTI